MACPSCKKKPDLSPAYREWVCENPDGDVDTAGYQISPFDAPKIITPAFLLHSSTTYSRFADFVNFGLGLPAEDRETTLTAEDLHKMFIGGAGSGYLAYVLGIDVGQKCHIMVGGVKTMGGLDIVHAEMVPHHLLEKRKGELLLQYNARITVMDSMPYFDMLLRMQNTDRNMWGALFTRSKDLELYRLKEREDDPDKAVMYIRQVEINRNRALDGLMEAVRGDFVKVVQNSERDVIAAHMTDMKRIRTLGEDGDFFFKWQKSEKKEDHYHHTLLYTWLASKITGLSSHRVILPEYLYKMRLKQAP